MPTGNHKLPLMMIGKSAKPRAFENINIKTLSIRYKNKESFDGWIAF